MSHSQGQGSGREKESRHLWVGGLPDDIDEAGIKEYFTRFGKIEGVKILPQKYPNIGVAAFIDFYDIKSATEAKDANHKLQGHELRTNFKANPGEKHDSGRSREDRSRDRDKHDERESDTSSSESVSGSSSSSSSSDSDQDSKSTKKRRKSSAGGFFIKATGLANRPDRVLQDGLFYEFSRYSNNAVVRLYSDSEKKWAIIKYKRMEKCKEALTQSQGMILFGSKMKLSMMDGDDFPPGGHDFKRVSRHSGGEPGTPHNFMLEDLDPMATRSLFVGNIPKHISVYELRDAFLRYGNVLDVEIKKMGGYATYGFILYYDLMSAVSAKQYMDGHDLKGNKLRVGFGKGTPSKQLWIDGIDPVMSEAQLERQLAKYGRIIRLGIDRHRCCAMVQFDDMDSTKEALTAVKGTYIKNSRKLMTDFANRDARSAFFARVDSGDGGMPPPRGFPGPPGPMYGSDMGDPRMMMPPRPGMHMMGRGGFPPHGPPMDYYFNPYMDDFYGGGRPPYGPPGMRHFPPGPGGRGYGRDGPDDYDEELRAFSRKREREKRRRQDSSSESSDSPSDKEEGEEVEPRKKRKASKGKEKPKKAKKPKKDLSDEGETDSDSDDHEEARLRSTRKSRDLREKLKKMSRKKVRNEVSSDDDSSGDNVRKRGKSKSSKDEAVGKETSSPKQRKVHKTSTSTDTASPPQEEARKTRNKSRREQKSAERSDSPVHSEKKRPRRNSSPDDPSPLISPPVKQGKEERETAESGGGSDAESWSKPQGKEQHQKKLKDRPKLEQDSKGKRESGSKSKALSRDKEASNGATAVSAKAGREKDVSARVTKEKEAAAALEKEVLERVKKEEEEEEEEGRGIHNGKNLKTHTRENEKAAEKPETPQSPIISTNSSNHGHMESELSSGEDFKETSSDLAKSKSKSRSSKKQGKDKPTSRKQERSKDGDGDKHPPSSSSYSTPHPRTPDYPLDEAEWKGMPRTPSHGDMSDEEEEPSRRGDDASRKSRQLPRRYQIEAGTAEAGRRGEGARHRENKDPRQERRHHVQPPSPPSPLYSSHSRKRYHHSPPPPEGFDRRRRRGRPYSPGGGGFQQRRRHSRSPPPAPYPGSPPPHRAKSPYGSSPPHSRPRSPIPRVRVPRRRYESPPFDGQRSKYPRGHGSPPSPHHRFPFTPSPPPRGSGRSPPGRRFGRRRSASLSPPPRGAMRGSRRDRSPPPDHIRTPPRDRYEMIKRHGKQAVFSRTPSPKDKYRDIVKEDYSDQKRRRTAVARPKSPSATPPPSREEVKSELPKGSRQQAHSDTTQQASDQRGFKQASSSSSSSSATAQHSRQSADVSTKASTRSQPAPPKTLSNPIPPPENSLLDLLRRYPVMWQGLLMLKNDSAAVQLHFLSGNLQLAKSSLPQQTDQPMPILRISQRMRLEKTQLEGVDRRIQTDGEHCLLLALPCGRDATDVHTQTHALKNNLINYLLQKQAAGIINISATQGGYVLHIFPPCPFSQSHLSRVAPDLLSNASVNCHLMIVVATM